MTATAHALIGASIAAKVSNPIIGIPLAIFSHFLADLIPHWDVGTNHREKTKTQLNIEASLDILLGFGLVFLIFQNQVNPIYLFSMVIAAQLPDWLEAPSWLLGLNIPPFTWFYWIGHKIQSRMQLPWGLVTQIIVVGLLLLASVNISIVSQTLASLIPAS